MVGALEFLASRVSHLVFVDAFVPGNGQSLAELNESPDLGTGIGAPWVLEVPGALADPSFSDEFFATRVSPHPARTHTDPVRLARPLEDFEFTRTYVKATVPPREDNAERGERSGAPRTTRKTHPPGATAKSKRTTSFR